MLENHRLNLYNNSVGPLEKKEYNAKSWDTLSQSPKHSDSLEKVKKGNITIQSKNYNFRVTQEIDQKPKIQNYKETLGNMLKR